MIAELRRKFVAVTMAAVAIVLAVILVAANAVSYLSAVGQVDAVLDILCANGGAFPEERGTGPADGAFDPLVDGSRAAGAPDGPALAGEPEVAVGAEAGRDAGKARRGDPGAGPALSPETPYDTRYFTVDVAANGTAGSTDTAHIAAVAQDEAQTFAEELFAAGATAGFVDCYRYRAIASADGGARYVFVDATRSLASFRSFRNASLLVGLAGLLCVLGVSVPLSARAVRPVARAYEKQRRFVTDASHELKTPLSIIGANTEVLELEQGESEWTRSTKAQVERLTDLVQKMLYLARMDEGGLTFEMRDFSLTDAVEQTVAAFGPVAAERGATLTSEVASSVHCRGDRAAIEQVLSILLDNALKYCGTDGAVKVRLEQLGKKVRITVWNTAEGLPCGALDMLFERFYRQDSSRNSLTGGHGVGLSIARAIVEAHKGKIGAHSDDGASLTCVVML